MKNKILSTPRERRSNLLKRMKELPADIIDTSGKSIPLIAVRHGTTHKGVKSGKEYHLCADQPISNLKVLILDNKNVRFVHPFPEVPALKDYYFTIFYHAKWGRGFTDYSFNIYSTMDSARGLIH